MINKLSVVNNLFSKRPSPFIHHFALRSVPAESADTGNCVKLTGAIPLADVEEVIVVDAHRLVVVAFHIVAHGRHDILERGVNDAVEVEHRVLVPHPDMRVAVIRNNGTRYNMQRNFFIFFIGLLRLARYILCRLRG